MTSLPIKTALKHAGAWGLVLTFVGLLTIIFSFLGTLFCAAIGGMMMGATHASRRLSLAFSTLCPVVLLATMRAQKTELTQRQITILAVLCLAVFWMLYLMALFLVAYEKSNSSANEQVSPAPVGRLPNRSEAAELRNGALTPASVNLRLAELEGKWCCEICGTDGHRQKRILEISQGTMALSILDAQGRICSCAQGRLKLLDAAEVPALTLSNGVELAAGI